MKSRIGADRTGTPGGRAIGGESPGARPVNAAMIAWPTNAPVLPVGRHAEHGIAFQMLAVAEAFARGKPNIVAGYVILHVHEGLTAERRVRQSGTRPSGSSLQSGDAISSPPTSVPARAPRKGRPQEKNAMRGSGR